MTDDFIQQILRTQKKNGPQMSRSVQRDISDRRSAEYSRQCRSDLGPRSRKGEHCKNKLPYTPRSKNNASAP